MESFNGHVPRGLDHVAALPFRRTRCDGEVFVSGHSHLEWLRPVLRRPDRPCLEHRQSDHPRVICRSPRSLAPFSAANDACPAGLAFEFFSLAPTH